MTKGAFVEGHPDRTTIFERRPLSTLEIAQLHGFHLSPPCEDFSRPHATARAPWSAVAAKPVDPIDITFNNKKTSSR